MYLQPTSSSFFRVLFVAFLIVVVKPETSSLPTWGGSRFSGHCCDVFLFQGGRSDRGGCEGHEPFLPFFARGIMSDLAKALAFNRSKIIDMQCFIISFVNKGVNLHIFV